MKARLPMVLAAIVAATATGLAGALDSQKSGDGYVYAPATKGERNPVPYVAEPVASLAAGVQPADAERLNAAVQAINADAAMKGSKVTLVPDGEVVFVTGVTVTRDQMKRALELAGADGSKVANAITTEELVIVQNPTPAAAGLEGDAAADASASAEVIQPATPGEPPILPATPAPQANTQEASKT